MFGRLCFVREATTKHAAQRLSTLQCLQEEGTDPTTCLRFLPEVSAALLVCSFRDAAGMSDVFAQSSVGGRSGLLDPLPRKMQERASIENAP